MAFKSAKTAAMIELSAVIASSITSRSIMALVVGQSSMLAK
jgi:hypothetical protein